MYQHSHTVAGYAADDKYDTAKKRGSGTVMAD